MFKLKIKALLNRCSLLLILLLTIYFTASYIQAELTTLQYLKVLSIYDRASYDTYRADLYKITSDKVFSSSHSYSGKIYPKINYQVKSIKCKHIKGFSSFVFKVKLEINGLNTINCLITIKNDLVVDAYREDD